MKLCTSGQHLLRPHGADFQGYVSKVGVPLPLPRRYIGIIGLARNSRKIQGPKDLDIKIRETKHLACARLLQIAFRHCVRDHHQRLGLWMARLDVTETKDK